MNQDREFEKYIAGKSSLSKLYAEVPGVEPGSHLDAAILAQAHRAVGSRPGIKPKRRWSIPLSLVASLIVVVIAGLQLPHILKDAARPQLRTEEKMYALTDKSSADVASPAPQNLKNARIAERSKAEIALGDPLMKATEAPAMPHAPDYSTPKKTIAKTDSVGSSLAVDELEMIVAAKPSRATVGALGSITEQATPQVVTPLQPTDKAARGLGLRENADLYNGTELSKEKKETAGKADNIVSDYLEQRPPAGTAGASVSKPVELSRSLKQSLKEEDREFSTRPDDWLKHIAKLRRDGRMEEAGKELLAFKNKYPGYRVPKEFEAR